MRAGEVEGDEGERNKWYEGPGNVLSTVITDESLQAGGGTAPSSGVHTLDMVAVGKDGKESPWSNTATVTFD